jgi:DNA-binding CsgD family transcriptional regulator
MTKGQRLEEREKELACIYSICLLAAGAPEPSQAAEGIARALCAAMQRESLAVCSISCALPGTDKSVSLRRGGRVPRAKADRASIESFLPSEASGGWEGSVRIEYRDPSLRFLPQEKALLDSVIVVLASMLRTAELIAGYRSVSENLAEKNVALREILFSIEEERRRMSSTFRDRILSEILPLAERARDRYLSKERRAAYIDLLVDELGREAAAHGPRAPACASLSPREREVAVQVRNGRTSKEIALLLGIAEATVERHRHNIRRKLKAPDRSVNLAGLLDAREPGSSLGDDL